MRNSDNWAEWKWRSDSRSGLQQKSGAVVEALAAGSTAFGGPCRKVGKVSSAHSHHQRRTGALVFCEFSTIPASACGVDLCKQPRWLLQKLGNLSANKAYSTLCGLTWWGATHIQLSEVCRLEMAWAHWVPKFFFYRQTTEDINAWWLLVLSLGARQWS